uniref:Uncharacterized protein n=1 Tax=Anguilla anguilla TaxID=7936 RepID=A0A0E9U4Z0_ANGAN
MHFKWLSCTSQSHLNSDSCCVPFTSRWLLVRAF